MSITAARDEGMTASERLVAAMAAFQGRLSQRIQRIAATIEVSNGRIVSSPANIARVSELVQAMKADFVDDEFADAVIAYVDSLDSIGAEILSAFEDFDDVDPDTVDAVVDAYRTQLATTLVAPETYEGSLWRPIANNLIYGAAVGALLTDTLETVATTVEGAEDAGGAVVDAMGDTVDSTTMEMQRTATKAVSDQVGVEFYLYQGRPIKTTRAFCAEREGRYWHREEIADWGRRAAAGEDLDGNGEPGWAGMVEGTNEQTIFLYLGGWYGGRNSCRHVLLPVTRSRVPAEDIERMRRGGYID